MDKLQRARRLELSDIDVKHKTFHVDRLKDGDSGPHELYNGESQAVKEWLLERVKMAPPAGVDTLFISERRKPLSRVTVWHMIGLVAKAAGLEHLSIHPHMLRHSTGFNLVTREPTSGSSRATSAIGRYHRRSDTPNWTLEAVREAVLNGGLTQNEKQQSPQKCPKCGNTENLTLAVTVVPDGSSIFGGRVVWDNDTATTCGACGFIGKVADFEPTDSYSPENEAEWEKIARGSPTRSPAARLAGRSH